MKRHSWGRADEFENSRTVFDFFVNIARFTRNAKMSESRSPSADTPRRNRDAQRLCFGGEVFDINVFAMQFLRQVVVIFVEFCSRFQVLFIYESIIDLEIHRHCLPQKAILYAAVDWKYVA